MNNDKKIWAVLPAMPKTMLVDAVNGYEAAGLEGVWAVQLYGSPFGPLSAAAVSSERLKLGTGVALAFTRSPLETACSALELDRISGGRCVLGIGPSIKHWNENWYGVEYGKPLSHLRETIEIVREIIAKGHTGTLGKIETEYYKLDYERFALPLDPVRTEIPVYLPAVYEKTTQMAGEIAQGLLGHPIWCEKWVSEQVARNLDVGLTRAGRDRSDFDLNLFLYAAPNEDKAEAIRDARATVAFYGQMAQYERYYEYVGFGDEARAMQRAAEINDEAALAAACTDEMVVTIAMAGTPDELRSRLGRLGKFANSFTISPPLFGLTPEKTAYYAKQIADIFYL